MRRLLNQDIESFILNTGADFVGFAKIEKQDSAPEGLNTAVSLGIAYKPSLVHLTVNELHEYIANTKTKMASVLETTEHYLQEQGYKTWVPQISETTGKLASVFSHKMAATISGLGWVGKNDIFISN